jgi:hypothetical protein
MANGHRPLLMFPTPERADERSKLPGGGTKIHVPPIGRQQARIAPQLATLQQAFDTRRLRLQPGAPVENPEMVLVLDVVGTIADFARAVSQVPGLDWLYEFALEQIEQDEDFYYAEQRDGALSGRIYLLGTNQEALNQLLALWDRYRRDPKAAFDRGLAPIKHVFEHLRSIRPWDVNDRVGDDVRAYWQDQIQGGAAAVSFEVEAWHFASADRNEQTRAELVAMVERMQGRVRAQALISEIGYHGFLLELPTAAIQSILDGEAPELLLSDRIMFFRPKSQSVCPGTDSIESMPVAGNRALPEKAPLVALLDGVPLANHALLVDRLIIDDPDGWERLSEVKDRMHGTAMASLIVHGGDLDTIAPSDRRLYVRPILRPDQNDPRERRAERTPDDVLLIDLIHRAVRRLFEADGDQPSAAPTIRIVNLSIGDEYRLFANDMSPWGRLLDWLAHRYSILIVVSAGNDASPLALNTPRDSLGRLDDNVRRQLSLDALLAQSAARRLMSPAESINALTVGALHADNSQPANVPNRYDLFAPGGISPVSRAGHGYRKAIKPDILMPGGRTLHAERYVGAPETCVVEPVTTSAAPGYKVAVPPMPGGGLTETCHCRGTSNAAALASRAAAHAYTVIEDLRARFPDTAPSVEYDGVMLKALLVHGASWGDLAGQLLARRPDLQAITDGRERRRKEKDFLTRWLGYGPVDVDRATTCTDQRATLLGFGEVEVEGAQEFSAPLPPSLAGVLEWRRMTITLAWNTPIHPGHYNYRRVKLWVSTPGAELRLFRTNSVDDRAALRGTVQHEVLEGNNAVAYVDGDRFVCKVNCAADAGGHDGAIKFALCVSLEVAANSRVSLYDEIRQRLEQPVGVRAA